MKSVLRIVIPIILAIVYVFIPTDFIADILPVIGWVDDLIAVLIAIANTIHVVSKHIK